jgi:hypothetical protein
MSDLSEAQLDYALADEVVELFEAHEGAQGVARAMQLVAAASKLQPRHRYKTAWSALEVWKRRQPSTQAFPMPAYLALGIAHVRVLIGEVAAGACVFLCFAGLLRISEALNLVWADCVRVSGAWVLIPSRTKRGTLQKVTISGATAVTWIDRLHAHTGGAATEKVCPIGYNTLSRWITWVAHRLGHGEVSWTSHSLRRGRATDLLMRNVPIENIMDAGRWESLRSCRLYLRKAEAMLLRARFDNGSVARATSFAALGARAWDDV